MSQLKYWNGTAWVTAIVGAAGPAGATGTAATVATGTTTTLSSGASATVVNAGTSQAAVLNFGIPQGVIGPATWPTFTFNTATTAGSAGAGNFSYNNATLASVTTIYFDVADSNAISRTAWYTAWGAPSSTIKGYLTIKNVASSSSDSTVFAVTSATNNTSYWAIGVTYISGSGTVPTNATVHSIDFARTGDTGGATGPTGPSGPVSNGIASMVTTPSITSTTETVLASATISANTMSAGTSYRLTVHGNRTVATGSTTFTIRPRIGTGASLSGVIPVTWTTPTANTTTGLFTYDAIITVKTAGASGTIQGGAFGVHAASNVLLGTTATVAVDTTAANLLELTFQYTTTGTNTFVIYTATIEQIK